MQGNSALLITFGDGCTHDETGVLGKGGLGDDGNGIPRMNDHMIADLHLGNQQEVHLALGITDANSTRNRNGGSITDPFDPRR